MRRRSFICRILNISRASMKVLMDSMCQLKGDNGQKRYKPALGGPGGKSRLNFMLLLIQVY